MKKINFIKVALIAALFSLSFAVSAQGPFTGFFKPKEANVVLAKAVEDRATSTWLFRPTAGIVAVELVWNKETKSFDSNALNAAGVGVGYQRFDDNLNNTFGINALVLLGGNIGDTSPANIKAAITVNALEIVNLGVSYDFTNKVPAILTGVTLSF